MNSQQAGHTTHLASKLDVRARVVDALRALEHLHDSLGPLHIQHLAALLRAVAEREIHNLTVPAQDVTLERCARARARAHRELDVLQDNEWPRYGRDRTVIQPRLDRILFGFCGLSAGLRHLLSL